MTDSILIEMSNMPGVFVTVDSDDAMRIGHRKVHGRQVNSRIYSFLFHGGRCIPVHRFVMAAQPGRCVDHINHDSLDCRKLNLRLCTRAENNRNVPKMHGTTSRFKGLYKRRQLWRAKIRVNGKDISLGYFKSEEQAARAYDAAAVKYHGEFAATNFPIRAAMRAEPGAK